MLLKQRFAVGRGARKLLNSLGYDMVRTVPRDLEPEVKEVLEAVRPFSMCTVDQLAALTHAVHHVVRYDVPGAFVECGVWRGGAAMAMALTLKANGVTDRDLYLFDTFEGMTEPTAADVGPGGLSAKDLFDQHAGNDDGSGWCRAGDDDVRANLASTGYPMDRVHLVKGKVEDTLPTADTGPIALLRLDTDWYESTAAEMRILYPRLAPGGVLAIDDYGVWEGSRRAVDEYFEEHGNAPLLVRVDRSGRVAVKPR